MGTTNSHGKKVMTPEEFDQLVRSSGFNSHDVHEMHEKFKKEFPKGYMDKKDFKKAYASMFPHGSGADAFAEHIFRIYDADHNGHISFDEFVTTLHISANGTPEEKLKSSFRLYDVDHNGSITQKELTQILSVRLCSYAYCYVSWNGAQSVCAEEDHWRIPQRISMEMEP